MKLPIPPDQLKKILIEQNLITSDRFDELYQEAERKNQSIIDIIVSEKIVEKNYLSDLIATLLGVPRANFNLQPINKDIVKSLAEDVARQRQGHGTAATRAGRFKRGGCWCWVGLVHNQHVVPR